MHKFIMSLQMGFMAADANHSGRIDMREITTALQNAGFTLVPQLMTMLMAKFDSSRSGQLDFEGFVTAVAVWAGSTAAARSYLAMAAHLAHMKTLFEVGSQGTGKMMLDYEQFTTQSLYILP